MGFAYICEYKESEMTRNGNDKHVGVSDTYFHVHNTGKAVYGKENLGDLNVHVIKVNSIVFKISHDKLT
jgi:hypothetical protein